MTRDNGIGPDNNDIGSKSIYLSSEFLELEQKFVDIGSEDCVEKADSLLSQFDSRRKKRKTEKRESSTTIKKRLNVLKQLKSLDSFIDNEAVEVTED